ncbi:hypothetical protein JQ615_40120 [Bradyrhizobium jicamae]|uniref:DUF3077 domain-containing protein n=1 Tax=Bradyrhizobium jicamae TaxID=280332 RepID=A0ABS5FXK9_9BRAD|nr:hypothetical protein [Bradyrhizobium jicamae]MBR0801561.1 hypothetical protein [Bradyrhizobium jicamae]
MEKITTLPVKRPWDKKYAEAYREMEGPLRDCVQMARIAADLMNDTDNGTNPKLVFAVFHLRDMMESLEQRYRADFGEGGT